MKTKGLKISFEINLDASLHCLIETTDSDILKNENISIRTLKPESCE